LTTYLSAQERYIAIRQHLPESYMLLAELLSSKAGWKVLTCVQNPLPFPAQRKKRIKTQLRHMSRSRSHHQQPRQPQPVNLPNSCLRLASLIKMEHLIKAAAELHAQSLLLWIPDLKTKPDQFVSQNANQLHMSNAGNSSNVVIPELPGPSRT
jgi:hypothetical protein